jgi:hypothetical protein
MSIFYKYRDLENWNDLFIAKVSVNYIMFTKDVYPIHLYN